MKKVSYLFILIIAVAIVSQPVFSNASNPNKDFQSGLAHYKQNQYNQAIERFEKVLKANPDHKAAKNNLLVCLLELANKYNIEKQFNRALICYEQILKLDPDRVDVLYNQGVLLKEKKEFQKALKSFEKVLEINPGFEKARQNIAIIYNNKGIDSLDSNYQLAGEYFQKSIENNSKNANSYSSLGDSYYKQGRYDLAIENYNKALELSPDSLKTLHNKEIALKQLEEIDTIKKIDSLAPIKKAPEKIRRLIIVEKNHDRNFLNKVYWCFDLLWEDIEGKKLLEILAKNNITIKIANDIGTNTKIVQHESNFNIFKSKKKIETKKITVNIEEKHINAILNSSLTSYERIYSIHTIIHECCHAAKGTINSDNSLLEEITASMIGYNVASRIINKRELTVDEVVNYSKICLKNLLKDSHRNLPVQNDFISIIRYLGINPPHHYLYEDVKYVYSQIINDSDTLRTMSLE